MGRKAKKQPLLDLPEPDSDPCTDEFTDDELYDEEDEEMWETDDEGASSETSSTQLETVLEAEEEEEGEGLEEDAGMRGIELDRFHLALRVLSPSWDFLAPVAPQAAAPMQESKSSRNRRGLLLLSLSMSRAQTCMQGHPGESSAGGNLGLCQVQGHSTSKVLSTQMAP
jgi:hypothetical protein